MSGYPDGMTLRPITSWPHDYTLNRRTSPFSSSLTTTLDTLGRELRHLGTGRRNAESVLQIAMREQDFRIDGLPSASAVPQHPGVILNIESRHGTRYAVPTTHIRQAVDALDKALTELKGAN